MKQGLRGMIVFLSFLLAWQSVCILLKLPAYFLPTPIAVGKTLWVQRHLLLTQAGPTILETVLGLGLGIITGASTALLMAYFKPVRWWLMPLLLVSQALPTFAIAPLLVLWLGYGITSKIIVTAFMLFFPVTSNFYQGLKRTPSIWLDYAALQGLSNWQRLWRIQAPAAWPQLANGIRIATAFAPMGAIIGEWVGASKGLGYLMLIANARLQIDLVFASLVVLVAFSLGLYAMAQTGLACKKVRYGYD